MNPLSLIKKALGTVAGSIPIVGGPIKDLIDSIDTEVSKLDPTQKAAFEAALRKDEIENFKLVIQDNADLRKLAMAELEHPGIKWIRPGILAGLFFIIVFWTVVVPVVNMFGVNIASPDISKIPEELWWLFGSSYLGYGTMREIGKKNKLNNKV